MRSQSQQEPTPCMDVLHSQQLPPSYQVPSHSEKGGRRVGLLAFHAPQTGSPVALGVRVGRQAGVVVGCGVVGCVLPLSPGISVSNNDRERGSRSPWCPAELRFREQW